MEEIVEITYCVAVKYVGKEVDLIGQFTKGEADRFASNLREAWDRSNWPQHLKPISIRVRKR